MFRFAFSSLCIVLPLSLPSLLLCLVSLVSVFLSPKLLCQAHVSINLFPCRASCYPLLPVFSQSVSQCVTLVSCWILIVFCPVFSVFSFASSLSRYVCLVPAVFPPVSPSPPYAGCIFKSSFSLCLLSRSPYKVHV